jgi:hypothetical protein
MNRLFPTVRSFLERAWRTDRRLTATAVLMIPVLLVALAGLLFDSRIVVGAPVWLKPAKFAISIGIYSLTLAWIFTYLPAWPRMRAIVSVTTMAAMMVEIAIIAGQAARGIPSHFNIATAFDGMLWRIMGAAIVLQTLVSVLVLIALWRERFADRALGWSLRLGLMVTILGASTGGLMAPPTDAQLAELRSGRRIAMAGAHTVGGPDGGAGLPGTGWSLEHGDIRVAHFMGLHAVQVLPALAILFRRRGWSEPIAVRLTITAAASYAVLFALLLWQALRGESLVNPDGTTAMALAAWAVLTMSAAVMSARRRPDMPAAALY